MAMFSLLILFSLPLFTTSLQSTTTPQSQPAFLSLIKQSLAGPALSRWDFSGDAPYCNFSGIACDIRGHIIELDLSSWSLTGSFPPGLCSALPKLRVLRLGYNNLRGGFPDDLLNCSFMESLNLSSTGLAGSIPDLSPLRSLRDLDISYNLFSSQFPLFILNHTSLESVNFNENPGFDVWRLPETFTQQSNLKVLILSTTSLMGEIPMWIGNLTSLIDLEFSGNFLVGWIPTTISKLENLQQLDLYYNELSGEIPEELGNLTNLVDMDFSVNKLTGRIPERLCALPKLGTIQIYNNSLTGPIPDVLGNSTSLSFLSLYLNSLTGQVPSTLGQFSEMVLLELSENQFTGELPAQSCARGKLIYFLVLDNLFSGKLPESYAHCNSLLRFRVSNNQLTGSVPGGLFGLPGAMIIDLGYNRLEGHITKDIGNAKNLSMLFMPNNRISGVLPPEISWAWNLVKIDLSNNQLSGPVPPEIGKLSKLNQLILQGNMLESTIPETLASLKSLNILNLSRNLLTGAIPESLCDLLPNSLDLSNNRLSGPIPLRLVKEGLIESIAGNPHLCLPIYVNFSRPIFINLCQKPTLISHEARNRRLSKSWIIGVSVIATAAVIGGALLSARCWFARGSAAVKLDERLPPNSSAFSYDVMIFHKKSLNQQEIVEKLIDRNIVGRGGSGIVYKVELSSREWVAVKKLSSKRSKDQLCFNKELRSEVETLGSVRHRNIIRLYGCFSSSDSNLLVYEYMPNGNLWDALHRGQSLSLLDWPTRHRITVGIAQGLAYLHHDLSFPIVHRDIKTSNILLDAEFEPKVADFGIAKVLLQARGEQDSTTTGIVGTYGYIAPEYAYTAKATTKCDVYSLGVVLMELVTGRKPNDPEYGKDNGIIHCVANKVVSKEGAMEVLDKKLPWRLFKEEMVQVLQIAIRCTSNNPALRPSMSEVVHLLTKANLASTPESRRSRSSSPRLR